MKKILLVLLFVSGLVQAETSIDPTEPGPLAPGRLIIQEVTGKNNDYILTDLKTGCQFLGKSGYYDYRLTPIGCFPEFIDPKFKK